MKFTAKTIFILIVLLSVIAIINYFSFSNRKEELNLYQAARGEIYQKVAEIGTVTQGEEISLTFDSAGRIKEVGVKTGDIVKRGQFLARIDDSQIRNQLEESMANLQIVRAEQKKLITGATEEEVRASETKVENAQNSLQIELNKLENVKKQAEQGVEDAYENAIDTIEDAHLYSYNSLITITSLSNSYFSDNSLDALNFRSNQAAINRAVEAMDASLRELKSNYTNEDIDLAIETFRKELDEIKERLTEIKTITEKFLYRDVISSAEKTLIDTHRSNINSAHSVVTTTEQNISSTKLTNRINIDNAEAAVTVAQDALKIAQDNLILITTEPRIEDIESSQAKIDSAQAKVRILEKQLEDTVLKSPVNGQIARVDKSAGEVVQSTAVIMIILPESPFEIETDIYEEEIIKVAVGNIAEIRLVALPEKVFQGRVASIDPAERLKDGVVYYRTIIVFEEEAPETVKTGMTADVEIITQIEEDILIVSKNAIQKRKGRIIVEVFKDDLIEERAVEVGIRGDDMVEIVSGLEAGEMVVIR
jgi:multidrug efflux pump subunit AcrA (membrane-fusion protein)